MKKFLAFARYIVLLPDDNDCIQIAKDRLKGNKFKGYIGKVSRSNEHTNWKFIKKVVIAALYGYLTTL